MQPRIYTEQSLEIKQQVELDASASTHLTKVLRLGEGSCVELFNGDGFNYSAKITKSAKRTQLEIETKAEGIAKSPVDITLVQGISRGDRMDFSIQKAVELGVNSIQPVFSEKCKVKLEGDRLSKKAQHWKSVAISACEQCGRSDVPVLHPAITLQELFKQPVEHTSLVLTFGDYPSLANAAASAQSCVSILVGPESGLSDNEISQAIAAQWLPCHLGPRVLRTETATISALSVLQLRIGDFNQLPLIKPQ